ncbi:hypothetical protein ACWIUD_08255 [Helicobacter sp. 23-1044]
MTKQQKQIIAFIAECAVWIAMIVMAFLHSVISGLISVIVVVLIFITAHNPHLGACKTPQRQKGEYDEFWQTIIEKQQEQNDDYWQRLVEKYSNIDDEYKNER